MASTSDIAEQTTRIGAEADPIEGSLGIPRSASGVVLFAHGSGSRRHPVQSVRR